VKTELKEVKFLVNKSEDGKLCNVQEKTWALSFKADALACTPIGIMHIHMEHDSVSVHNGALNLDRMQHKKKVL